MKLKEKAARSWKSFTIWFNGVMLSIVPFADTIIDFANETIPLLQNYITDKQFKTSMIVIVIVGNILLRFKTSKSLAEK